MRKSEGRGWRMEIIWKGNASAKGTQEEFSLHHLSMEQAAASLWAFFIISLSLVYDSYKKCHEAPSVPRSVETLGENIYSERRCGVGRRHSNPESDSSIWNIINNDFHLNKLFFVLETQASSCGSARENRWFTMIHFNYEVGRVIIKWKSHWYFRSIFSSLNVLRCLRSISSSITLAARGYQISMAEFFICGAWNAMFSSRDELVGEWKGKNRILCTIFMRRFYLYVCCLSRTSLNHRYRVISGMYSLESAGSELSHES